MPSIGGFGGTENGRFRRSNDGLAQLHMLRTITASPRAATWQCAVAQAALDADPGHNLAPYQRLLVYRTLGPRQEQTGRLRRVRLALLAVD